MILLLSGPDLPYRVKYFEMVESIRGILAFGGTDENINAIKSISRLSCNGDDCKWIKEELELICARHEFIAIPLTFAPITTITTIETTTTTKPILKPTPPESTDAVLVSLFDILLGYTCIKSSDTSFECARI